ncbi:MAG: isoleucine--tRNA ligase [Chloroflexi bacterium RBG_16_68_14]|nr:MAG: isoleucine--tRNA ligase [Chloroflexi bacterium RBG_16_68_14]
MFRPVDPKPDFPALERETLRWWDDHDVVAQYLRRNEASPRRWSFIDGPITANNPMGVHHAWGRTYKDVFQRHRTMRGFRQRYQNGFDCQGLWIEVEVERELSFTSKHDIEAYGIDRFVEACKERVRRFADQITEQSIRLGYWMDWDNSYFTNSDENNYAIWHFLKACHRRGWLYKGFDVMPWCPRCATGLSNMEIVTEGYRELTHPSVYLKFPLEARPGGPALSEVGGSLLVWTTTPWTLAANVAAAVHPDRPYLRVRQGDDVLYLAKAALGVLQGDYTVEAELPGRELVGLAYRGPFDELPAQQGVVHRVIEWEEVSEEEGTGVVHIAPGCGQEDFALSKQFDLAVIAPIDEFGNYLEGFGFLDGRFAGEVGPAIFDSLREKGLRYRTENYTHRYPVCWRCGSELLFRLVDEWFISMDELRYQIADVARKIRWIPDFGLERELDWLRNMADWMISKKRYYGLALPIYPCACGHVEVIGGREELREKAAEGWEQFEGHSPHRPWVDTMKIRCPQCGEAVSRIADVGNPWLDAGIVPFATLRYDTDHAYWQQWFPADFITESFPGQFRNWFYALLAMSTVLENREPFRTVLGHGQVRDEHGEDMHASKGNAIWFDEAAERMGADVMRWLFLRHNPSSNVNFGWAPADEVRRSLILTLWNTYSFFVTYANIDRWRPPSPSAAPGVAGNELDRWVLSELHQLITDVSAGLEDYDTMAPCRRIEAFVEDLSNWYVRRSRRRFWKSGDDADKRSAYETLYQCLVSLAGLLAPFMPFLAEELYQNLVRSQDGSAGLAASGAAPPSVHLCDWPEADSSLIDQVLNNEVRLVMRLASLGRSARSKAGIKVRQPLPRVFVKVRTKIEEDALARMRAQLEEELNVKEVQHMDDESHFLNWYVQPNLPVLGPKYGADVNKIRAHLVQQDPNAMAAAISQGQRIEAAGFQLEPNEVLVTTVEKEGFASAQEAGYVVVVDTEVPPELRDEGLARELVHRIQNLRREAGFDISDRITAYWQGDDDVRRVLDAHADYVKGETLSLSLVEADPPSEAHRSEQNVDGHQVVLGVRRTRP